MVETPQEKEEPSRYRITFHRGAQHDLADINAGWHESIYDAIEHKLGLAPKMFGDIVKQSNRMLWRTKFAAVRIIYTILETEKEIVILSIRKRATAYERNLLARLMRLAYDLRKR